MTHSSGMMTHKKDISSSGYRVVLFMYFFIIDIRVFCQILAIRFVFDTGSLSVTPCSVHLNQSTIPNRTWNIERTSRTTLNVEIKRGHRL